MRALIEMCKLLDNLDGVNTRIQGDSVFANGIEIRTTIDFDDLGNYKYIIIHDHKFSDKMNFFDAVYFAQNILMGKKYATNDYQTC
jgi:hypothetical protein